MNLKNWPACHGIVGQVEKRKVKKVDRVSLDWYHLVMRVERLRSVVEAVRSRRESFLKPFSYAKRLHNAFVEKFGLGSALMFEGCLLGPPPTLGLGLLTGNPLASFIGLTATLAEVGSAILVELHAPGSIRAAVSDLTRI